MSDVSFLPFIMEIFKTAHACGSRLAVSSPRIS